MINESTVINTVCKVLKVEFTALARGGHTRPLPTQRYILFYFLIKYLYYTLQEAGDVLYKDHATALRGRKIVENIIKSKLPYDKEIQLKIKKIDNIISGSKRSKALYFWGDWRLKKTCFITSRHCSVE
ncbi:MAG: hypothetical protein DRI95_00735 [Bacteroidetes bacterium]|nr:MAG: hypothetical protein DRI95_00735 [Bacteroidota bacterium]